MSILALCETGQAELLSSEALIFETQRIPNVYRRENAFEILSLAKNVIEITAEIEDLARRVMKEGVKPLDALHLATATNASADYFCTCDSRLLKKGKNIEGLNINIVSPLELVEDIER